jgi:hypothetical protein
MAKIIKLIKAEYIEDYTVRLYFDDEVIRDIDFGHFLKTHPHPQHNKYLKYSNFKKFKIENGNIVWGKSWDLIFDLWDMYKGKNPN